MNRTETPDPATYPVGSAESRAAARLRAESLRPLTLVVAQDIEGNPIWDQTAVYGPTVIPGGKLPTADWMALYAPPPESVTSEAGKADWLANQRVLKERRNANSGAWLKAYARLAQKYGGRVPGAVAAAWCSRWAEDDGR
jgi:hypothetical protein